MVLLGMSDVQLQISVWTFNPDYLSRALKYLKEVDAEQLCLLCPMTVGRAEPDDVNGVQVVQVQHRPVDLDSDTHRCFQRYLFINTRLELIHTVRAGNTTHLIRNILPV